MTMTTDPRTLERCGFTLPTRMDHTTSDENNRYSMAHACVHVRRNHDGDPIATATTTNGHSMTITTIRDMSANWPTDSATLIHKKALPKTKTKRWVEAAIDDGEIVASFDKNGNPLDIEPFNAFPPTLAVMPTPEKLDGHVMTVRIVRLIECLQSILPQDNPEVADVLITQQGNNPAKPLVMCTHDSVAILMPTSNDTLGTMDERYTKHYEHAHKAQGQTCSSIAAS